MEESTAFVYRPRELTKEERRGVATSFLECAVCHRSLQFLETAVACPRCEIRRYCSVEHRDYPAERGHYCQALPVEWQGMGKSLARDLDFLTQVLPLVRHKPRADGLTLDDMPTAEDLEHIAHDVLASFFDVAYYGVVVTPLKQADVIHNPEVKQRLGPDFVNALVENTVLRMAVSSLLDIHSTTKAEEERLRAQQTDPKTFIFWETLLMHLPLVAMTIEDAPSRLYPNDPIKRKRARRDGVLFVRRLLLALMHMESDDELRDLPRFYAKMAKIEPKLFEPWRSSSATTTEVMAEEVSSSSSSSPSDDSGDDYFMDMDEPVESDDGDDDDFMDVAEYQQLLRAKFAVRHRRTSLGGNLRGLAPAATAPSESLFQRLLILIGSLSNSSVYKEMIFLVGIFLIRTISSSIELVATQRVVKSHVHTVTLAATQEEIQQTYKNVVIVPLGGNKDTAVEAPRVGAHKISGAVLQNLGVTTAQQLYALSGQQNREELSGVNGISSLFSPLSLKHPVIRKIGEFGNAYANNIALGFGNTIQSLGAALATLRFDSTNPVHADGVTMLILFAALRCAQTWVSVIRQIVFRTVLALGKDELVVRQAAKTVGDYLVAKINDHTTSTVNPGGRTYREEERNKLLALLGGPSLEDITDTLFQFYMATEGYQQNFKGLKTFLKELKDGEFPDLESLKKYIGNAVNQWNSGFFQPSLLLRNIETSNESMLFTIFANSEDFRAPPASPEEREARTFRKLHRYTVLIDLFVPIVALGLDYFRNPEYWQTLIGKATFVDFAIGILPFIFQELPAAAMGAVHLLASLVMPATQIVNSVALPAVNSNALGQVLRMVGSYLNSSVTFFGDILVLFSGRYFITKALNYVLSYFKSGAEVGSTIYHTVESIDNYVTKGFVFSTIRRIVRFFTQYLPVALSGILPLRAWPYITRFGLLAAFSAFMATSQTYYPTMSFFDLSFTLVWLTGNPVLYATSLAEKLLFYYRHNWGADGPRHLQLEHIAVPDNQVMDEKKTKKLESVVGISQDSPFPSASTTTNTTTSSSLTLDHIKLWEPLAGRMAKSNREFEDLVCQFFNADQPGRGDRFRTLFANLRVAATNFTGSLLRHIAEDGPNPIPEFAHACARRPLPPTYRELTDALNELLRLTCEPVRGRRLFKTDAKTPDEAVPFSIIEQAGADKLQRLRHDLARLIYWDLKQREKEEEEEEDDDDDDDDDDEEEDQTRATTFEGRSKNQTTRSQRKRERRARYEEREKQKTPFTIPVPDDPLWKRAQREATRLTSTWTNAKTFFASLLSSCTLIAKSAAHVVYKDTGDEAIRVGGNILTIRVPLNEKKEPPSVFVNVLRKINYIPNEAIKDPGLTMRDMIERFMNSAENDGLISKQDAINYLKQHPLRQDLQDIATVTVEDVKYDSAKIDEICNKYQGTTPLEFVGDLKQFLEKMTSMISRNSSANPAMTTTPPDVPSSEPTLPSFPADATTSSASQQQPPPAPSSSSSSATKLADQIGDFGQFVSSVIERISSHLPSWLANDLPTLHYALFAQFFEFHQMVKDKRSRFSREVVVVDGFRSKKYWIMKTLYTISPLIINAIYQYYFGKTFFSNSTTYFYALQFGFNTIVDLHSWWYRQRHEDSAIMSFEGTSLEGRLLYILRNIQFAFPMVSFIALRNTDAPTVNLVTHTIASIASIYATSLAIATVKPSMPFNDITETSLFKNLHYLSPWALAIPPALSLARDPLKVGTIGLVAFCMHARAFSNTHKLPYKKLMNQLGVITGVLLDIAFSRSPSQFEHPLSIMFVSAMVELVRATQAQLAQTQTIEPSPSSNETIPEPLINQTAPKPAAPTPRPFDNQTMSPLIRPTPKNEVCLIESRPMASTTSMIIAPGFGVEQANIDEQIRRTSDAHKPLFDPKSDWFLGPIAALFGADD